jgi:hypothetical protein
MSAFHVSDDHINILLSWARKHNPIVRVDHTRFDLTQSEDYWRVGAVLRDANNASMYARYGDKPEDYLPKTVSVAHLEAIDIVSGCDCFDYQACEYSGWESSGAKNAIDQIRNAASRNITGYGRRWQLSLLQVEEVSA